MGIFDAAPSSRMILGLSVALLWGAGDLCAAIAARRFGALATLVLAQGVELALCIAAWMWLRPTPSTSPGSVITLLFVGLLTAVSYGSLYRGMVFGPVSIVTAIGSAYAAGPAILAVILLHESISRQGAIGAAATVLGVVIVSAGMSQKVNRRGNGRGISFGILAAIGFAISAFLIAMFAGRIGWLLPLLFSRVGVIVVLVIVIVGVRPSEWVERPRVASRTSAFAVLAGTCNLAGTSLYAHAGQLELVAVVSAISALFPLVPIVGGLLVFGERLTTSQIGGILMILAGLLILHTS